MFNNELTLDAFVCSSSICQPKADLGSILNVFQSNNCDLLAISLGDSTWGTISSHNLLSLLAKAWQSEGVAMIGHPKNLVRQERVSRLESHHLSDLIEPAIIYSSSTKLQTFLDNLDNNSLSVGEYLVFNELGKLQGRLNTLAILKYLASQINEERIIAPQQPANINSVCNSIDSVELPLKIETSTGQDLYANQRWQELMATTPDGASPQLSPDTAIANWWVEQQSGENPSALAPTKQHQLKNSPITCCGTVYPLNLPLQSTKLGLTKTPSPLDLHSLVKEKTRDGNRLSLTFNPDFEIQIEQTQNRHQIKISISLVESKTFPSKESLYWLVLSAQAPVGNDAAQKVVEPNPTVFKAVVKELLGTISHELKSPITGIIGLSSLLKDRRIGELNQRQTRYTNLIGNSGQKLLGIINDLLELVSLTNEQFELNPESINLKCLCRQLYQQTLEKLRSNSTSESELIFLSAQLNLKIEPEAEIAIADKRSLSAILSYLLIETLQFADLHNNTIAITVKEDSSLEYPKESQKTKIVFSNQANPNSLRTPAEQDYNAVKKSSGWNLILAKYLAQEIQADIESSYGVNGCQLSLSLPASNSHQSKDLSPSKPALIKQQKSERANITILCLYPELEAIETISARHISLNFNLKDWAEQDWSKISEQQLHYQHRIIEADGLAQAHTLARIWQLDAIILDGHQLIDPTEYLRSLQESEYLENLPLITLDTKTTQAANQIEGLNVYPCLLPAECRSIENLIQVIQIATGI